MLRKLIKYDLKALNRFLIIIHCFLMVFAVLTRFFLTERITDLEGKTNGILLALTIILYVILIIGVTFGTYIVIGIHFYQNLFSNEGYLSRTLPVTCGQHLLSKTITGSVWGFIDTALVMAAMYITIATPAVVNFYQENRAEFLDILGLNEYTGSFIILILFFVLSLIIDVLSNVLMLYASIALGQLFSGHRILGAVVMYFVLTTLLSLFAFTIMLIFGIFNDAFASSLINDVSPNPQDFLFHSLAFGTVLSFILTVALYIVTYFLMKRKINLA